MLDVASLELHQAVIFLYSNLIIQNHDFKILNFNFIDFLIILFQVVEFLFIFNYF
jgi:hypothetical protein